MDYYLTLIMGWGPTWPPRQFTTCSGQLLAISQFTAVFSLIGTIYGGDGRTSFGLPDLRGRAPVAAGQSPATSFYNQGARQGSETYTLSVLEMPLHNHGASANMSVEIEASTSDADSATPMQGSVLSKTVDATNFGDIQIYGPADGTMVPLAGGQVGGSVIIGNTGGSQPFSIVQPIQVIQFIFCMEGIFPPRN